jgi:SMI1 / KNR4 family (SUKH-1)
MPSAIERLLAQMQKNPGASEINFRDLVEKSWVALPEWYLDLLRLSNGAEGPVGSSYLGLWPAEEVINNNDECGAREFFPGMLLFGSDMGGTAYAFDGRDGKSSIVEIPFISNFPEDVIKRGDTLEVFLQFLISQFPNEDGV